MKKIVGIILFASLISLSIYGIKKMQQNSEECQNATGALIDEYLTLIKNEQYEEAYNKYWLEDTKLEISFDEYKKTFEDRNKKLGKLKSWESDRFNISSNIFTGESVYESDYFLYYEGITYKYIVQFSMIEENDSTKIEMTYEHVTSGLDRVIF